MKYPIIVSENGSLILFKTVQDAENYLEPIDIINQEYEIFDSDGKILRQRVAKRTIKYSFWRRTVNVDGIYIDDGDESNPERLKKLLQKFLKRSRKFDAANINIDDLDLADLIETTLRYTGYTK
ncbi:MAG: hypothetical protein HQL77_10900 [Magnetococcales bacterium]|nr:hypothetical protein [Magnetococcales bacterium]